ncbi:MAG TPA: prephenate dehydrogenase [Pirellulales bacterium]|nr:prephenate dehydrogenase [Pirellulales bacterium]
MKTWNCVTIVGVGLIGGSVGLALRARNLARRVIGTGSRPATLAAALELGVVSQIEPDACAAAAQADLLVVCAPVAHIAEQVRRLAAHCRPGTLITDAGSTKAQIVRELDQAAEAGAWSSDVRFVGSHPLAGNEKKGPGHATAELFVGRAVVITPGRLASEDDCASISEFWKSLGARTVLMPPGDHDRALATTSHLPHLLASAIAGATPNEYVTLTAGGWLDTTRIAGGDPVLWRQIMLANRDHLLESLDGFTRRLADWRAALEASDAGKLERLLEEAKQLRDSADPR